MEPNGQKLAETYLKMLNTHDPDLVDQFVAENYINHNAFVADGREANRQFWHAFFVALPDVSARMEDLVIAGDRVVGRFVYRGTHTGDFMGIPASGSAVEMRSIDIWRIEDGMFAEHWDELNTLQVFQQMGALPPLAVDSELALLMTSGRQEGCSLVNGRRPRRRRRRCRWRAGPGCRGYGRISWWSAGRRGKRPFGRRAVALRLRARLYDLKGSADQAYAQRDNCETLQYGSGDDDSGMRRSAERCTFPMTAVRVASSTLASAGRWTSAQKTSVP